MRTPARGRRGGRDPGCPSGLLIAYARLLAPATDDPTDTQVRLVPRRLWGSLARWVYPTPQTYLRTLDDEFTRQQANASFVTDESRRHLAQMKARRYRLLFDLLDLDRVWGCEAGRAGER